MDGESAMSFRHETNGAKEWPVADESENISTSWRSMFAYTTKHHHSILCIAWILTILSGISKPTISIFLGFVFDEVTSFGAGDSTRSELLEGVSTWCLALTALGLATWFVNGGFFALWLVFGELQAREARTKLFAGMLEKEMEWYDVRRDGISSLLIRVQTQIRELQIATSQPLGFFLEDAAATVGALGIAFFYSWKLTLVILAIIPFLAIILAFITKRLQPAIEAQKRQLTVASKHAHTAILHIDTVKVFNAQEHEVQQYAAAVRTAAKSYLTQANANALQIGVTRFVTVAMFISGFWYGLILVNQGLGAGKVLTTFYACMMATQSTEALLPQFIVLAKGMSAGKTLRHIMLLIERGRTVTKMVGSRKPDTCYGDVEVSNVTFSYPSNPGRVVLSNASFFFPAGETTFVVGRSGSGKSTLSNLILKFYKPSGGNIFIDGEAVQTLDIEWLRNNIFLLQQQSTLFNESMFRNIAFGRRKHMLVTKDDIELACQTALLGDTVHNLPDGLNTILGAGGNSMSGGQKQRVAIARSKLRDAPILILDEATSSLDNVSKTLVMDAIRHWRHGKTTIIITHDISQIQSGDYVYVLDQGRVVEEGYRSRLVADPFSLLASFLPTSTTFTEDVHGSGSPKERPSSESHVLNVESIQNSAEIINTSNSTSKRSSHIHRISSFLGIASEAAPRCYVQNRRTLLGLATAFAHDLISENVWQGPQVPPGVHPRRSHLMKPLPSLPEEDRLRTASDAPLPEPVALFQRISQTAITDRSRASRIDRRRRAIPFAAEGRNSDDMSALLIYNSGQPKKNEQSTHSHTTKGSHSSLRKILGTVWPRLNQRGRLMLVLAFISAFINAAATPIFSYVFAQLLNTFYLSDDQATEARKWALITLAIAILDAVSSYFFHYLLESCGQIWVDALRVEALSRILAQPRSWFDKKKHGPEKISEVLDRNAEEMRNLVGRFTGYVFVAASMMSIAIIWAFIVCWKLTLVGIAGAPIMYAFTRAYETVNAMWEKKSDQEAEHVSSIFTETFSNIRVVRALILEDYFKSKQANATLRAYQVGLRRATYSGFFFGLSDSTNFFVTALVLYYGAAVAGSGQWSVSNVLVVITLLLFSSANANAMLAFIPQINSSKTTATHMLYLANLPKRASHEAQGTRIPPTPFPIQLNSLSFAYPASGNILHKVTLDFQAGSCTAIVGSSGSGKSTIASLLVGIYPPNDTMYLSPPSLTYAGVSFFDCHMPTLRNLITIVSQTPVIFPITIAANIAYGLPPVSPLRHPQHIERAARDAGIHDFVISLPRGYSTLVGDGGQGLSGGQAQRISIARALIRRPKVLILDEATSALDVESANVVRDTVMNLTKGKGVRHAAQSALRQSTEHDRGMAVVIITHAIEMMKIAERIVMLDHGRVVEEGPFDQLARARGPFAKLVAAGGWSIS